MHIIGRTLLPALMVISLLGLAFGVYDLNRQIRTQQGIDAHTQRVDGTVTGGRTGYSLYAVDSYTVTFVMNGATVETGVPGLRDVAPYNQRVCLEVDSEKPYRARLCGTRGGVAAAQRALILPSVAAAVFGGLWGLYLWRRRVAQQEAAHPLR
jgi:hypothetical protein